MRKAFYVLCLATCSGIAGAQEPPPSNFEACVSEARQRHADSAMETYLSFKCEGAAAQRLAARPDQCFGDVKPALRSVERRSRQLGDGLYMRIVWRTDVCAGMCETRFYTDARETSYLCEVRRHLEARAPLPPRNPDYDRRYTADDPPASPPTRGIYGPAARPYDEPRYYYIARPRTVERWYYIEPERYREIEPGRYREVEPGRYREYRFPDDFVDDAPRDERRDDGYRRDDYRDYRRGEYLRRDDRADDDRRDGYRLYEYR